MTAFAVLRWGSLILAALATAYLAGVTWNAWRRQRRSYAELPFPDADSLRWDEHERSFVGAMVGVAVGDALGQFRESLPVWLCRIRYSDDVGLSRGIVRFLRRKGTVTDDTQLTACVAHSFDEDGEFQPARFPRELERWSKMRIGAGKATTRAVTRLVAGDAEPGDRSSQGNGAAMRVVPLALGYADDEPGLRDAIVECSRLTHQNPEAIAAAELVAMLTRMCVVGEKPGEAAELVPRTSDEPERWQQVLERALEPADDSAELVANLEDIGTSGWVFESIPAAVHLFATEPEDWRAGLRALFAVGGDVDTIAALYCSWVGALHGPEVFEPFPAQVQGAGVLVDEARRLADMRQQVK